MNAVHIFDDGLPELSPLTDLRAGFEVRTGALTNLERLTMGLGVRPASLHVPRELLALVAKRHAVAVNVTPADGRLVLLINGRCVIPPPGVVDLKQGEGLAEDGVLVAACVDAATARGFLGTGELAGVRLMPVQSRVLLSRPWHVRHFRDAALAMDLRLLAEQDHGTRTSLETVERPRRYEPQPGIVYMGADVVAAASARICPGAVLDSEHGPIHLAECAVVRPGAVVIGPCFIGANSTVLERATIRGGTAIGPWCKVNGEVGGTIFQGYANKAHDGYLGDAWVGEWVNLGAGTTVSNLLNTYGEVITRGQLGASNERTGETFLGPVIGDHVKTAICTRIMTGSVLHTGSMFATTAPVSGCVGAFTWATDAGTKRYRFDKFLEVAREAMARRKIEPGAAYVERLGALHGSA